MKGKEAVCRDWGCKNSTCNVLFGCHNILEILGGCNAKLEFLGNLRESQYLWCLESLDAHFSEIVLVFLVTSLRSRGFDFHL